MEIQEFPVLEPPDIFNLTDTVSIPIIAVTGTNGKTTTTRMISRILRNSGLTVGTTTTHGIYINDKCIEEGDTTGPISARRILDTREVDAAVLETARGGIVRAGLGYKEADVAVFTNLTGDHLGLDGINTIDELLNIKSRVIEAVKENGTCVLNADDPWIMKAVNRAGGSVLLFSLHKNNPYLSDHINAGKRAVYLNGNSIYTAQNGVGSEFIKVEEIPATFNGGLKHNIYNSMAAIGACMAVGVPDSTIAGTLKKFYSDENTNPGRFNVYTMENFTVVLDYGHNIDGYIATVEGLKSLNPTRMIGIIGVPGDRRDEDIIKIGRFSGRSFDKIIIKEDRDLRQRQSLEVANILYEGVLQGGASKNCIEIIPNEEKALENAIITALEGDVIVVFFEKREPLVDIIKGYSNKSSVFRYKEQPLSV